MNTSVKLIAKKLGFGPPKNIEFLNNSKRTQKIPYELKQAFWININWNMLFIILQKKTLINPDL